MTPRIPKGWTEQKVSSVFTPLIEKVGNRKMEVYSCTNVGIFPREDKFQKKLAISIDKNKVAYKGNFVFGMSREILNFGMMQYEIGCFSSAYKVYKVNGTYNFSRYLEKLIRCNHDYYYQSVTGGAREGKGVSEKTLMSLSFWLPPENELESFYSFLDLMDSKQTILDESNKVIEGIRNSVIPAVIAGEISLPDFSELMNSLNK